MNCPSSLPTAKGRMVGYDENANESIKPGAFSVEKGIHANFNRYLIFIIPTKIEQKGMTFYHEF